MSRNHTMWTDEERELLRQLWPAYLHGEVGVDELLGVFRSRTFVAIQKAATRNRFTNKCHGSIGEGVLSTLKSRGIVI